MHLGDDRDHGGELGVARVEHQVGTLGHDGEVVVGEEGRDLDDDVLGRIEARHLEVHPDEHRGNLGRPRHGPSVAAEGARSRPGGAARALR